MARERRVGIGRQINSDYPFLGSSLVIGTVSIVDLSV